MKGLPPSQVVDVAGQSVEYISSGAGTPPIVLVNGAGGPIEGWYRVYPALERLSTVVAYNRLGLGRSSRPVTPQTGAAVVATLRGLLREIGLPPPYVLVGHSLGGLHVNLYARLAPNEVAGVVLLDATAPGDEALQTLPQSLAQRMGNIFIRLLDRVAPRGKHDETLLVAETVGQIAAAGPFPAVPLVVVSGGKKLPAWLMPAAAAELRAASQRALAALSPQGRQVLASRSGHFPQLSEPEAVVRAVRDVLEAVRG